MREIKFRAWDKRDRFMFLVREMYWLNKGLEVDDGATVRDCVDGDTGAVMQYTGLKDKNGKEIYEGDILLIPDEYTEPILDDGSGPREEANHLAPIVFKGGQFGVDIQESADVFKKGFTSFQTLEWEDSLVSEQRLEVIGNIYENPELLESKR